MKTIFYGGKVFTGLLPLAEAFMVEDGRFTAVGTDTELLAQQAEGDTLINLEGRFACPGFNDSHMHLVNYGNLMNMCDLTGSATVSLAAVQNALRAFAAAHPEGWIIGRGWNQDYFSPATDIPTRQDLDAVCADRPICITRCCGHCLVVNTCALDMLGIDASTPVPEGGAIDQAEDGTLTGVFRDTAMVMIQTRLPQHDKAAFVVVDILCVGFTEAFLNVLCKHGNDLITGRSGIFGVYLCQIDNIYHTVNNAVIQELFVFCL